MKRLGALTCVAVTLFAVLLLTVRLAAQEPQCKTQRYTVQDIGTLGGTFSGAGEGFSNSGLFAGYSTLPGDKAYHAFLWQKDVMIDLGTLGGLNSEASFKPSDSGDVGGWAETSVPDPNAEDWCGFGTYLTCLPFHWRNGVMTPLPTLGGNNGFGVGMNNRGEEVGSAENTTPDPACGVYRQEAVIWTKGQVYELPPFPGDTIGAARQINDWGQATGWSGTCAAGRLHALLWQNGTPIDLGNLGGTVDIAPWDINNQGQIVGYSYLPDNTTFHAFLWQKRTGMIDLGTLPGDVNSGAGSINNKGQVVGGSINASDNERAFLWQNGVMTDLNMLIPPDSPLYLLEADGINDRGQIEGYGWQISTDEVHVFLATPTTMQWEIRERPKVVLPENVRKQLQQLRGGRFGVGLTGRQ